MPPALGSRSLPPWSRIGAGAGSEALQCWAGDLVPDAVVAYEGGRPLVAVAVLALHVADAVGRVAVVGADVARAGHGAACAAPAGRSEPRWHLPVLGGSRQHLPVHTSAWWHPSVPAGALQRLAVPSGTPLVSIAASHCPVALTTAVGALWHPLVADGTHQCLLGSTQCYPLVPVGARHCLVVPTGDP